MLVTSRRGERARGEGEGAGPVARTVGVRIDVEKLISNV